MDVTFVLEESGVTATVEVPCEADVAAAKEVACTALAVSPASVEMRIGTQVLEGTCRLQDTAFGEGVQVVLACPRLADIKCPAEYRATHLGSVRLSRCGTLCIYGDWKGHVGGFDTETFETVFSFELGINLVGTPVLSQCKTRCYVTCKEGLQKIALPGGEVLHRVDGHSYSVFACGGVVLSKGRDGVSVYDEDLTLLRSLSHEVCSGVAVSDCGGWVITSSETENNARLWDVNTGEAVACVPADSWYEGLALSRAASVFAVPGSGNIQLYDWSGAALGSIDVDGEVGGMQFTPCGKYLVAKVEVDGHTFAEEHCSYYAQLHQYDVATLSCVRVMSQTKGGSFVISPCSCVVVWADGTHDITTEYLYPHNSE